MNALALPLLFFLHAYHPHPGFLAVLGLASLWHSSYDDWLMDLQRRYDPPNEQILVIETIPENRHKAVEFINRGMAEPSDIAVFHVRQEWESVPYPENIRNRFGLVIIQRTEKIMSTHYLEYCAEALVRGGKLIIVEGRDVLMVIEKDGEAAETKVLLTIPHLNRDDITIIHHLMNAVSELQNRILLVGETVGWINPLRKEGWLALGVTTQPFDASRGVFYHTIRTYQALPFQSTFFKIVFNFVELDMDLVYNMDLILIPGGYFITVPQMNDDYEHLLEFLGYKPLDIQFHHMPIWKKKDKESA